MMFTTPRGALSKAWNRTSGHVPGALLAFAVGVCAPGALAAQSFFASIIVDPSVGVDRGSAAQVQKLDERTGFLTFDTYGALDIGRSVAGFGFALPDLAFAGDQLDVVGVIAGPSSVGGTELLSGGIAYRFRLGSDQTTAFVRADYGDFTLGTAPNYAIGAKGERSTLAFGIGHKMTLQNDAKLSFGIEAGARKSRSEVFGTTVIDENLRYLRASALYEKGIPFFFQQRFAAAVTKGFDAFGASPAANPLASSPGASSAFLRVSFSAEASLPLSRRIVTNLGVVGQWSDDSLPISQRCGYGTNAYMRGFDLSYVNGDTCFGGRVEMAYNVTLPTPGSDTLRFTQAYFGVDNGWIKDNANALLPSSRDQWSSGSLGVRTIQGNLIGELSATRIFDEPTGFAPQSRNRLWLRAAIRF